MKVNKLDHISIAVRDLEVARRAWDIKGRGEMGALAESFERMQASVRSAIKRLQKRQQ